MADDTSERPPAPALPKYLREPLEKQSPERLETVASYATELAEWKRRQNPLRKLTVREHRIAIRSNCRRRTNSRQTSV
jgi:hypothetical protein